MLGRVAGWAWPVSDKLGSAGGLLVGLGLSLVSDTSDRPGQSALGPFGAEANKMYNKMLDDEDDDKDDDKDDNYHRSILGMTNGCDDNLHRNIFCISNAAEKEMMRTMMIIVIRIRE